MRERSFGAYLYHVIRMKNMTQKEAAKLLHISPQTLNNYILDKRYPDMEMMIHILKVFHLDANRVFQLEKEDASCALSIDEMQLIQLYRSLDLSHQKFVLNVMKVIPKKER